MQPATAQRVRDSHSRSPVSAIASYVNEISSSDCENKCFSVFLSLMNEFQGYAAIGVERNAVNFHRPVDCFERPVIDSLFTCYFVLKFNF